MPLAPDFDLYEALEVPKDASAQEITASYRRLARVHHPDKNLENTNATAKFQQVSKGYHSGRSMHQTSLPYRSYFAS